MRSSAVSGRQARPRRLSHLLPAAYVVIVVCETGNYIYMAETIAVTVKLFAALRKFLPAGSEDGLVLKLPVGSTVQDAIDALGIPSDHAGMLVSKDEHIEANSPLADGQELSIFPPLAGGAV